MKSRKIKVGDVCKLNASTISTSSPPNTIQYLDTGSITRNRIEIVQILNSKTSSFPSRAQRIVKKNTIIYSTVRPNLEHFGILENPPDDLIVSTGFLTIDVGDPGIDPKYLYYVLTQKHLTNYLHTIAVNNVSSYPSIKPDDIGNLFLTIPFNIVDQQKIAAVLSTLDAKIELNNRINIELEAMAKTLYDYWFVQFDFPDKNGKPYKSSGGKMVWNEELKREIPEGWKVKNIGDVAIVKAGGDKPSIFSDTETSLCSIPIYSNGILDDGLYGYTNIATIDRQSITISARGTIGYTVLRHKPFVPIIRLIVVTPHDLGVAHYFKEYIRDLNFSKNGSIQQQLTVPHVSSRNILWPSMQILHKFESVGSATTNYMESIKKETQQLAELRDWLLPMLMNGQVKVN